MTSLFTDKGTVIWRSHGLTSIVERFNRTLGERLFSYQYDTDIKRNILPVFFQTKSKVSGKRDYKWVDRLQKVVDTLNGEFTRLIGMSPNEVVKTGEW